MALCTSREILRWWIFLPEALFFRLLLCSSLDTLSHAVGNPTHQVKGIQGGSVLFPANISQGITVEKMEWDFLPQRGGLGFWLGEFSHGKLEQPSPTDRFGQRLDMVDETTLRIKDLELDDGGIYNARIWFTKAQFQEQSFSLTVYEPVPTPQIDHQVESKTPGGCNVTLRCHTPGREELKVSWEIGDPHSTLGKSVNQYQVYFSGRELRVFYWKSSFDSKFTCLVSNPVDQKRASFNMLKICQSYEGGQFGPSSWSSWLIPSVIVLLVITEMVRVMWMCYEIRLERNGRGGQFGPSSWSSWLITVLIVLVFIAGMVKVTWKCYKIRLERNGRGGQFGPSSWSWWLITALIVLLFITEMVRVMWEWYKIRLERNGRGMPE